MKKILLSVLILLLFTAGCSPAAGEAGESSSIYLTAMDTVMKLTAYGPHRQEALEQAQEEIERPSASEIPTARFPGSTPPVPPSFPRIPPPCWAGPWS